MKTFLRCVLVICQFFLASSGLSASQKPLNILLFLTDDESALERSAYGWSSLDTPHFDRVVENGILFKNGYTSTPSCAPARASILTGRSFWENEQGGVIQAFLPDHIPVVTEILREQGYETAWAGKPASPTSHPKHAHTSQAIGQRFDSHRIVPPAEIFPFDYASEFGEFLGKRDPQKPFFFWAGTYEPRLPIGPDNYKRLEAEFGISLDAIDLPPRMEDTLENRKMWAGFLYEIRYADEHLGRMMASLEEAGEMDNTLIIATSDNGTALIINDVLYGKASPYDLGVRVPLAMMWPKGINHPGRTVTDFVNFSDFAPTILDLAGIEIPAGMTGSSLVPIFEATKSGQIDPSRNFIRTGLEWHGEFDPESRSARAIRYNDMTYIVRYENVDAEGNSLSNEALTIPAKIELYDLSIDPWQLNDLVNVSEYADELEMMARLYKESGIEQKDPRVTGEMDLFRKTREYVQKRKRDGYRETRTMPFPEE